MKVSTNEIRVLTEFVLHPTNKEIPIWHELENLLFEELVKSKKSFGEYSEMQNIYCGAQGITHIIFKSSTILSDAEKNIISLEIKDIANKIKATLKN